MEIREHKHHAITEKIMGAAMKVHAAPGNGFQEVIYQRALEIELEDTGLKFARESGIPVYFKPGQIGERRADFVVEERIMVELKDLIQLENTHLVQAQNYLEAYNMESGLLINFGAISLQFKRLENQKFADNTIPLNL